MRIRCNHRRANQAEHRAMVVNDHDFKLRLLGAALWIVGILILLLSISCSPTAPSPVVVVGPIDPASSPLPSWDGRMRIYLNAYGAYLDGGTLATIKTLGFDGLRRDVHDVGELRAVEGQHRAFGLELLVLVNTMPGELLAQLEELCESSQPTGIPAYAIEMGNEWDRYGVSSRAAKAVWQAARCSMPLVTGGITSLSKDALNWLPYVPEHFTGVHSYRTEVDPRFDNVTDRLRSLTPRRAWNTEAGWHTERYSEQQVADFLLEDMRQHAAAGVEVYTVYQLDDGEGSHYDNHFGIRRLDGTLKPAAYVARRFKEGQ